MAERDRRVIEQRRQLFLQLGPPQLDRRCRGRRREDRQRRRVHFDAARRLRRRDRSSFDADHGLGQKRTDLRGRRIVVDDDLREAARVAKHEEGQAAELPPVMEPPCESDALADAGGQLVREQTLQRWSPPLRSPGGAGGRRSRCATALRRRSAASLGPVTGAGRRGLVGLAAVLPAARECLLRRRRWANLSVRR